MNGLSGRSVGLSSAEARERLAKYGYNEILERKLATFVGNVFKILSDPMGLMLLILSAVYLFLGKRSDATILLVAYLPIIGIDVLLELRSQTALRSLRKTLKPRCHAIRDGKTKIIPSRELVPGDLLVLEEGQTLPADGTVAECSNLTVDEASVTGESVPVEKAPGNEALSGTTVLTGSGTVLVEKTGLSSRVGAIAKVLGEFTDAPSPLLRSLQKTVRYVYLTALGLATMVFVLEIQKSISAGSALISALTLAMAAIPEEFPLVFTLYLSMAAYRLSRKGILVKSLPSVEGLGRVDVICTDKTGTLTEGKFRLERVLSIAGGELVLGETELRALIFSCEPKAVDAMEAAIYEKVSANLGAPAIEELHQRWSLAHDYLFDTREKYMSHVWTEQGSGRQFLAMKGALEGVLAHCDSPTTNHKEILRIAQAEAEAGRRLLGLAMKEGRFTGNRCTDESSLRFVGILSFTDPVRPSVKAAIRDCVESGIQVKMLTGDHLLTAHAVADKIGLPHESDQLFSGPSLERLPPEARRLAYREGAIFARLKPEQKLEMVGALKAEGDIVAMTGDGINDAPALKLADIGISMGESATDVARSTARLVLLKNDFDGIVSAVREGQRVLASLSQSFGYLIAFHLPVIGLALFQSLFLRESILLPIHIVLLQLIVHPISAFVFDAPQAGTAKGKRALIERQTALWSAARGCLLFALALAAFFLSKGSVELSRTLAVVALVTGSIGLLMAEKGGILASLGRGSPQRTLFAFALLLGLALALAFVPNLSALFSLVRPPLPAFTLVTLLSFIIGAIAQREAPAPQP